MTAVLGDVCLSIVDCEHKTAPTDATGEYFAVGTPAMRGNTINYSESRQISAETFRQWTQRLRPRFGDLLLAREAPVGPVVRIPANENVAPGQRTVLLRPNPERVNATYLYYLLGSAAQQSRMHALAEGSTVPHLNVADVRSLLLPALPSVEQQHRVARVLGALDDKIAANTKLAATADALALALTARFAPSVALNEVAAQSRTTVNPETLTDDQVDHFSLPAFDEGHGPERVSPATIKSGKFEIGVPSVLISKLNPRFPRVWNVAELPEVRALASTEFVVLEPASISTALLWSLVAQPRFGAALEGMVAGTSGSHQRVKPDEILRSLVPDPRQIPAETIGKVESLVSASRSSRSENNTLTATRDALLPALMSGRLTVREAAEVAGL